MSNDDPFSSISHSVFRTSLVIGYLVIRHFLNPLSHRGNAMRRPGAQT
jgi:hypothetical protein